MIGNDQSLSVLIIDDSVVFRLSFYKILKTFPEISEVMVAPGGNLALAKVAVKPPDVVFCDIEMPEESGDGISTLKKLKTDFPSIGVVMVSGINEDMAMKTIHSLYLGAVDFIPKPNGSDPKENERNLRKMVRPIISLFSTKKYTSSVLKMPGSKPKIARKKTDKKKAFPLVNNIEAVLIGSSTGGPKSLMKIIPKIPSDFEVPVFIVQHMQSTFTKSLADYLREISEVNIKEAEEGEEVKKGNIYMAPGGKHLVLKKGSIMSRYVMGLNDDPPVNFCKPSIDVFFESAASVIRDNVISVILTGMGRDGTKGVGALKEKGCISIVQDEKTSVIYGMPESVVSSGYADEILPDTEIGNKILSIVANKGKA